MKGDLHLFTVHVLVARDLFIFVCLYDSDPMDTQVSSCTPRLPHRPKVAIQSPHAWQLRLHVGVPMEHLLLNSNNGNKKQKENKINTRRMTPTARKNKNNHKPSVMTNYGLVN